MGSVAVVVLLPDVVALLASANAENSLSLRHSSRKRPLKLSTKAFWVGFPGAM